MNNYTDRLLGELNSLKLRVENLESAVNSSKYSQLEFYSIDDGKKKTFEKAFRFNVLKNAVVKFKMSAAVGGVDGKAYVEIFVNGVKVKRFYNANNSLYSEFEATPRVGVCDIKITFMYPIAYTVTDFKLEVSGYIEYEKLPSRLDAIKLSDKTVISYVSGSTAVIYLYDTALRLLENLQATSIGLSLSGTKLAIAYINSQRVLKLIVYNVDDMTKVSQEVSVDNVRKVSSALSQQGFCFYALKNNRCYKLIIDQDFSVTQTMLEGSVKDVVSTPDQENLYIVTDFSGYSKAYYNQSGYRIKRGENYHLFKIGDKLSYSYRDSSGSCVLRELLNAFSSSETASVSDEFVFLHNGKKLIRNNNKISINED